MTERAHGENCAHRGYQNRELLSDSEQDGDGLSHGAAGERTAQHAAAAGISTYNGTICGRRGDCGSAGGDSERGGERLYAAGGGGGRANAIANGNGGVGDHGDNAGDLDLRDSGGDTRGVGYADERGGLGGNGGALDVTAGVEVERVTGGDGAAAGQLDERSASKDDAALAAQASGLGKAVERAEEQDGAERDGEMFGFEADQFGFSSKRLKVQIPRYARDDSNG